MKTDTQKPSKACNRTVSRMLLTEAQRDIIVSHLPTRYSLVSANDWNAYQPLQHSKTALLPTKPKQAQQDKAALQPSHEQMPITSHSAGTIMEVETVSAASSQLPPKSKKVVHFEQESKQALPKQENRQQKVSYGSEQKLVLHLIAKVISHSQFAKIYSSKMQPSAQTQIRAIKQKLKGQFSLLDFKSSINQLFTLFFQQVGHNQRTVRFKDIVNSNIDKYLSCESFKPSKETLADAHLQTQEEVLEKPNKKKEEESKSQQNESSEQKDRQSPTSVRPRSRNEDHSSTTANTPISVEDMATLGYNMQKLSSANLKWICQTFIKGSKEKIGMLNSEFSLDIESLSHHQFSQLELFVKNKLRSAGKVYERVPDEDKDFVIEDDSEAESDSDS